MARIVITEFVSLDGVMEAPGGDDDFVRGAWTFEFDRGDEGNQFKVEETLGADALLLGKKTYEGFAAAWPSREGEFADHFNNMKKYVVSSTLQDPDWTNTEVLSGGVDDVAQIREEAEGNILLSGSAQLAKAVIAADLVDELRLMVFPVVLGTGKRLFGDTDEMKKLKLTRSDAVGDGVLVLVYERP
jgi:dihydrofolate reductase